MGCRNDGKGNIFCTPPPVSAHYDNKPCPDISFQRPRKHFDMTSVVAAKGDATFHPPLIRWQGMLGISMLVAVGATVYLRKR